MNECIVKYIHIDSVDPDLFRDTKEYEMHSVKIRHDSYENLHDQVFASCPANYVCREPLALFHEVLWSRGIQVDLSTGERKWVRSERDELRHAIERLEYPVLWNSRTGSGTPLSICVDVDAVDLVQRTRLMM
jgi:hypothetical protein